MKKNLLLTLVVFLLGFSTYAQLYVSTVPENKKVIIEEFTGVKCPNCPDGHQELSDILAANPGVVFAVAYHPTNSSYTTPYAGDPDFRRVFADAFYSNPYCGTSRFMPSAFTNRREYGGEKIQSRSDWAIHTTEILGESSPVNVGLNSTYNSITNQLDVTVEIYYTDNVTDVNTYYVMLTESNLVSQQSGATGPYTHHRIFRESLTTGQWGDPITTTTLGHLETQTLTFDNSATGYDMNKCDLVAFVINQTNEEVISGIGAHVGASTTSISDKVQNEVHADVYPNPVTQDSRIFLELNYNDQVSIKIFNSLGMLVYSKNHGTLEAGNHSLPLIMSGLSNGIYLLNIEIGDLIKSSKIVVE